MKKNLLLSLTLGVGLWLAGNFAIAQTTPATPAAAPAAVTATAEAAKPADAAAPATAAVAHQQVLPQLYFQQTNLPAQRRLRHIQAIGSTGKTAHFSHTHKVFDLFDVHPEIVNPIMQIIDNFDLVISF